MVRSVLLFLFADPPLQMRTRMRASLESVKGTTAHRMCCHLKCTSRPRHGVVSLSPPYCVVSRKSYLLVTSVSLQTTTQASHDLHFHSRCVQNSITTASTSPRTASNYHQVWPWPKDYIRYIPPPIGLCSQRVSDILVALMARNKSQARSQHWFTARSSHQTLVMDCL
jgi:hypothetical protein